MEVKTGAVGAADRRRRLEFTRRFPGYRPLVIGDEAALPAAQRAGVEGIAWRDFLVAGPPGPPPPP